MNNPILIDSSFSTEDAVKMVYMFKRQIDGILPCQGLVGVSPDKASQFLHTAVRLKKASMIFEQIVKAKDSDQLLAEDPNEWIRQQLMLLNLKAANTLRRNARQANREQSRLYMAKATSCFDNYQWLSEHKGAGYSYLIGGING